MENNSFKVGDIVTINPSKEKLEFINRLGLGFEEFIGEKAVIINSNSDLDISKVQYLKSPALVHSWNNKDLTLVPTEREFSGEV